MKGIDVGLRNAGYQLGGTGRSFDMYCSYDFHKFIIISNNKIVAIIDEVDGEKGRILYVRRG